MILINPYAFATASGGGGTYLDSLATLPQAVFSLRKMYSTASNAIRVRRSTDNAETDIGFSGDTIDTATLLSFVGVANANVVTFYDQTGNGFHATQATAGSQARIVLSGVYDGKLVFSGDLYKITSLTLGTPYVGLYAKWEQATNASTKMLVESTTDYFNNNSSFACYELSTQGGIVGASQTTATSTARANAFANASGQAVWSILYDRTLTGNNEIKAWRDGSSLTPTSQGAGEMTSNYATNDIYIGARGGGSLSSTLELETLVLYNADTSAIRADIEGILA